MKPPAIPSLEGLETLSRRKGVDIRPTLIRVLTDLYVQKPWHSLEEEQHYTELVLQLIEAVDISTRAIVAHKLAAYPAAPGKVVRRLARDVLEVAEPLLRYSRNLTSGELQAIIAECGPRYAAMIASRGKLDRQAKLKSPPGQPSPAPAQARTGAPGGAPAGHHPGRLAFAGQAGALGHQTIDGEKFLAASRAERRKMLEVGASLEPPKHLGWSASETTIGRLEAAALARNPELFARELERAIGVPRQLAKRLLSDRSGEPLLAALKALAMPSEVVVRVLLFLDPVVGQSIERVFDLAGFYQRIDAAAAVRLLMSLGASGPRRRREPVYRPVNFVDDKNRFRRGSADLPRRQLAANAPDGIREPHTEKSRGQGMTRSS